MHIELISKSAVKITLTGTELSSYSLEFDLIDSGSPETRRLLSDVLDRLLLTKNIDLSDEKLYIEVFPEKSGGCLMYISNSKGGSLFSREPDSAEDIIELVFSCRTIPELISRAVFLDLRIGEYIRTGSLYYSDSSFELIAGLERKELIKALKRLQDCSDAVISGGSGIRAAYIREHCTPLLEENAVKRLTALRF